MPFQPVLLWTDALIYVLILATLFFIFYMRGNKLLRDSWREVLKNPIAMASCVILLSFSIVGLLDSIHFHPALPADNSEKIFYSNQVKSVLDVLISSLVEHDQQTYSAPFTVYFYAKSQLQFFLEILMVIAVAILLWFVTVFIFVAFSSRNAKKNMRSQCTAMIHGQTLIAWRSIFIALGAIYLIVAITMSLSKGFHLLGTDKVGQDVFYETLKSIRTGLVIGTLTTLFMLPFAILFGTVAGYFGGLLDDIIQYIYITLSSIPAVLLITASILSLQIFVKNHPDLFTNLATQADARLLILCAILGITSWTELCRLLRGETLKLREADFVQAALVMGVSRYKIITTHIVPNVIHIILITIVLNFSALVLAEAVLSYVGVGVDPTMPSWGNMINSARLELAREPVVWWPLCAAFIFMFMLVLSANLFADAVRDAFDPRLRGTHG